MILRYILQSAHLLVVAGAFPHTQLFHNGNLKAFDPVAVPSRLKQGICEAKRQQVLDGFLTQIAIDPVDLRFFEVPAD